MKTASQNLLQTDAIVQGTLLFPMLGSYLLFALGMAPIFYVAAALLQLALAFAQLVSGMAHVILFRNKPRRLYLAVSITYVLLLFVLFGLVVDSSHHLVWIISTAALPVFIGLWYFWITISDLRAGNFEDFDKNR